MKTKFYLLAVVFVFATLLGSVSRVLAQRGHYGNRGRGWGNDRHHYYRSYPPARYYSHRSYYYNRPYLSLHFGGNYYRYQSGYYYRPYGASFQFVLPPFGLRIGTLPPGYRSLYLGPDPYYYYGGVYYRSYGSSGYEVVKPPLGAVVEELPPGAQVKVIDGRKYYELNGTYYEETINDRSELEYTVVGTDGVLNTGAGHPEESTPAKPAGPAVGDRFDDLPSNSRAVVINGEKLYLSPSGLYYKEMVDGNRVVYEVVGK